MSPWEPAHGALASAFGNHRRETAGLIGRGRASLRRASSGGGIRPCSSGSSLGDFRISRIAATPDQQESETARRNQTGRQTHGRSPLPAMARAPAHIGEPHGCREQTMPSGLNGHRRGRTSRSGSARRWRTRRRWSAFALEFSVQKLKRWNPNRSGRPGARSSSGFFRSTKIVHP